MANSALQSRLRLSDTVCTILRDMIVHAEMPPGSRIAESEIAERLGMSRTPIREALLRLADEGLVQMFPQSGIFVTQICLTTVSEAQFIREHLECAVIRELAGVVGLSGMAMLRAILMRQEAAQSSGDLDEFYALDEGLHAQFCILARREGVWRTIQHRKTHLDRVRWLSLPVVNQVPHLIEQHRAIVDALCEHDPDAAETSLRFHLREVYATIKRLGLCDREENAPLLRQ